VTDLPLFPLPELVVFPGMTLPLYIFEERYRKMVRECVETNQRRIVLVLSGTVGQISDAPELQKIAAVGSYVDILSVMENADGTFHILTHGQGRCQVKPSRSEPVTAADGSLSQLHYTENLPYPLSRDDPNSERLAAWDALEVFREYARSFFAESAQAQLEEALPDDLLFQASFICANVRLAASARQELLEAPSLIGRFGAVQRYMREQLSVHQNTEKLL
jgi:Lon protease-like protein